MKVARESSNKVNNDVEPLKREITVDETRVNDYDVETKVRSYGSILDC